MAISPRFLPEEFFVRVRSSRAGYFDTVELPYFDGYKQTCYIQFNSETNHFRTVKKIGKKLLILDGFTINWIENENGQERVMDDDTWTNYIVGYRHYKGRIDNSIEINVDVTLPEG